MGAGGANDSEGQSLRSLFFKEPSFSGGNLSSFPTNLGQSTSQNNLTNQLANIVNGNFVGDLQGGLQIPQSPTQSSPAPQISLVNGIDPNTFNLTSKDRAIIALRRMNEAISTRGLRQKEPRPATQNIPGTFGKGAIPSNFPKAPVKQPTKYPIGGGIKI